MAGNGWTKFAVERLPLAAPVTGGGGSDPADRATSSTNEMSSAPSDHSGHHQTITP